MSKFAEANTDVVVLVGEDGSEHEYLVMDIVEFEGRDYALLVSSEEDLEGEDQLEELLVLRFKDDSDELIFIEDTDEFQRLQDYLDQLNQSSNHI